MTRGYYDDPRNAGSYDLEQAGRDITTEDIPFYLELARETHARGLPVLELAAGTGRVTLPIAREGIEIAGLDSAAAMLDVARAKSDAEGLTNVRWLEADMANFALDQRFGLAIIPFRSFLLLTTVSQQLSCLRCIHDHLVDGGRLALNIFNPDLMVIASWLGDRKGLWEHDRSPDMPRGSARGTHNDRSPDMPRGSTRGTHNERSSNLPRGTHRERWLTRRYDTSAQQLDQDDVVHELSDEGAIITRIERNLRLRYVFRYEMQHLLSLTGFTVDALHGWFDRRDFTEHSNEMVWLASKSVAPDSNP